MGGITSCKDRGKKTIPNERTMLKKVWSGIENNIKYHANIFFMDFCEAYPQYTKYFTFDPDMPLTVDVQTTAKFTFILDAMGYLIVYFYDKPKRLKFLIGYIAMVHKDMNLRREDMNNFAESLISYLASSFPQLMTSESEETVSNYIKKIVNEISNNIDDFKKNELFLGITTPEKSKYPCIKWICREKLIYGNKLDYWMKRKRTWEERLKDWKLRTRMTIVSPKNSSTDEDEIPIKKKNDDSTTELVESYQVWEPHLNSRTNKQLMDDNMRLTLPRSRVVLKTKKPGQTKYNVVEMSDFTDEKSITQKLESPTSEVDRLSEYNQPSTSRPSLPSTSSLEFDSPARRRYRQFKLAHNDE